LAPFISKKPPLSCGGARFAIPELAPCQHTPPWTILVAEALPEQAIIQVAAQFYTILRKIILQGS
jgi:hypothetical protein